MTRTFARWQHALSFFHKLCARQVTSGLHRLTCARNVQQTSSARQRLPLRFQTSCAVQKMSFHMQAQARGWIVGVLQASSLPLWKTLPSVWHALQVSAARAGLCSKLSVICKTKPLLLTTASAFAKLDLALSTLNVCAVLAALLNPSLVTLHA